MWYLLDFAPIGHAALALNLRPQFGVLDALQNLHRLDVSLLDGLMTRIQGRPASAGRAAAALSDGTHAG
jgi:Flp pilus assembly CpaE family ATPase